MSAIQSNSYTIAIDSKSVEISDEKINDVDIRRISDDLYHVISRNESIQARIIDVDQDQKNVVLEYDNIIYRFNISTALDKHVTSLQKSSALKNQDLNIKSSMPGLVLDVLISEGDEIVEGQAIMIIEAMKMENVIKAKFSGRIKSINCANGDAIDKNQLLVECESLS